MIVRLTEPELLDDLALFLARHRFVAARVDRRTLRAVSVDAANGFEASAFLHAATDLWATERETSVYVNDGLRLPAG